MRCLTSGMGRKAVVGIAAALIVCPIVTLVGYKRWIDTRTFNPLDIPVSLSQDHFKTPEFYVNLKGQYAAKISVGYAASDRPECQEEALQPLRAHFIAYQNGVPVGETDQPGYAGSGSLDLEKRGYYSLDVKILSDASCLDSAHPRLQVWTWGGTTPIASTPHFGPYRRLQLQASPCLASSRPSLLGRRSRAELLKLRRKKYQLVCPYTGTEQSS